MAGSNAPSTTPEVPALSIDALKKGDKDAFNAAKIQDFFKDKTVESFNLDTAIALTALNPTPVERELNSEFNDVKLILLKYNKEKIMVETSEQVVIGQLDNLKTAPTNMPETEARQVLQAYRKLSLLRDYARNLMAIQRKIFIEREQNKFELDGSNKVKELMAGVRENWDKWDLGKKAIFSGALILGTVLFLKSENETVKGIKSGLKWGLGIVGGAWLLNAGTELVTGESIWDRATGHTEGSSHKAKFYIENFATNAEGAKHLSTGFVRMGNESFLDLLDKYETAKSNGSQKIEGAGMNVSEAYKGLDIFFRKYDPKSHNLRQQYENIKPPITYLQAAADLMARDPNVKMQEKITTYLYEGTSNLFNRAYNYVASSGPASWVAATWKEKFGKEPTKEEIAEFIKKFSHVVKDEKSYNLALETVICKNDRKAGIQFGETLKKGSTEAKYPDIKYLKDGDYIYVIAEKTLGSQIKDEKSLFSFMQNSKAQTEAFLSHVDNVPVSKVPLKNEIFGSVYIADTTKMRYLVRYKRSK